MSLRTIAIASVAVAVLGGSSAWAQSSRPSQPSNLVKKNDNPSVNNNRPAQPTAQIIRRTTPNSLQNSNANQNNNNNNNNNGRDNDRDHHQNYYVGGTYYQTYPPVYYTPVDPSYNPGYNNITPVYPTTPPEFFGYTNPGNLPSNGQPYRPIGQNGNQITYPTPRAGFTRDRNGNWQGTGLNSGIFVFRGYRNSYVQYQSVISPFGAFYGCPQYIGTSYIISSPWAYARGQNIASIVYTSDRDLYVLSDADRAEDLKAALGDLRRFWENEDARILRKRVRSDQDIAILENEEYRYSVNRANFLSLANDALASTITLSFEVTDVQKRNDGLVNVYAKHQYRLRETGEVKTAKVRSTLIYLEGAWYITGISLAP